MDPIKIYKEKFGVVEIYQNYLICIPNSYTNMGIEEALRVITIGDENFKGSWAYIGNRKNNSSVDPTLYFQADEKAKNVVSMAIVAYSGNMYKFAELEKTFVPDRIHFRIFTKLDDAIEWTLSFI